MSWRLRTLVINICILLMGGLTMTASSKATHHETAVFAMGCFWCAESEFRDSNTHKTIDGIIDVRVGYTGGVKPNPTYEDHEGYKEGIKITFDPDKISYEALLKIFWKNIDPLDKAGQFCDKGFAYTSAIFYSNDQQKDAAQKSLTKISQQLGDKNAIATEILPLTTFHDAEDYHQNYKSKNPIRYKYYRWNCGRDQRLAQLWGAK